MKRAVAVIALVFLVSAAFAAPFEARLMTSDRGLKEDPAVEIIDRGEGDTAAVVVVRKAVFEPFAQAVLTTCATRPRVIAFLINGQTLESFGGIDGLSVPITAILEQKGIQSACIVSCDDCIPLAVKLAESLDLVSSLVVMTDLPSPTIPITKTVYIASGGPDSLLGSIDKALRIIEIEPPKPLIRRGSGFIPR